MQAREKNNSQLWKQKQRTIRINKRWGREPISHILRMRVETGLENDWRIVYDIHIKFPARINQKMPNFEHFITHILHG